MSVAIFRRCLVARPPCCAVTRLVDGRALGVAMRVLCRSDVSSFSHSCSVIIQTSLCAPHHSSVNLSNRCILKIITNSPTVTMMSKLNPNQPNTIALVPTPLLTFPFPKSCAICAAATEAVCCHSTLTRTKMEAMKIRARATCETGREGKGLMSMSEPVRASCSSCQPGKVARRRKVTKARTMATMLCNVSVEVRMEV